jgi:hypothetical protein
MFSTVSNFGHSAIPGVLAVDLAGADVHPAQVAKLAISMPHNCPMPNCNCKGERTKK